VDVSKLASEVFGSGRLQILRQFELRPARYSDLSKALRSSEGELSRNLARLVEAGLATKHPDGSYTPTPLALVAMAQAPNLEFLATHDEFVRTHALHQLGPGFLRRLDDLGTAQLLHEPFALFGALQTVFRSIERRFWAQWIIAQTAFDENELDMQRELAQRIKAKRPEVRIVALVEEVPLYENLVSQFEELVQARTIPSAAASIALSDTAGLIQFNDLQGRIDTNYGFFGQDKRFLAFLADLIEDGWARGAPTRLVVHKEKAASAAGAKRR
jgi:predicted transcriptional regulator